MKNKKLIFGLIGAIITVALIWYFAFYRRKQKLNGLARLGAFESIWFQGCNGLDEIKQRYRELALAWHPDREGGDTATMQDINNEYQTIIKNAFFDFSDPKSKQEEEEAIKYPDIIQKLVVIDDILIEVVGTWIWVSGYPYSRASYPHRFEIAAAGLKWSKNREKWYYHPEDDGWKRRGKNDMTMDEIRAKYGSKVIRKGKDKDQLP